MNAHPSQGEAMSGQLRITCPLCKKPIAIDPTQSGTKFSCPHCGQRIQAPAPPKPEPTHPPANQWTMLAEVEQPPAPPFLGPTAPPPPPHQVRWSTQKKLLIIGVPVASGFLVLVILLIVLLVVLSGPSSVTASKILTDYERDRFAADAKYIGKEWKVSGKILYATVTMRGGESLVALDEWGDNRTNILVIAYFQNQDGSILPLRRGQRVTFIGKCAGLNGKGGLLFEQCTLH